MLSKRIFLASLFSFVALFTIFLTTPDNSRYLKTEIIKVSLKKTEVHGTNDSFSLFIENILYWLLRIVAFVAVLFMAIGGLTYMIGGSTGNEKFVTAGKNAFLVSILGLTIVLSGPSILKEIKNVVVKEDTASSEIGQIENVKTIKEVALSALELVLSIIAIIAIISLSISGIMYLAAGAQITQVEKAKKAMIASIIGFAMAGSALIIVQQIANLINNFTQK